MVRTFAAIDVGSFELEMGIYEISEKTGVRSIDHVKHMIALGKDTFEDGKISYQMVEETCRVLKDFATACYITNPNSHPTLPDDRIIWNKRKFIWRTSL